MNQYETVFILTPVLSDVQMKEAVEKFKGILTAAGAEIINEENWGNACVPMYFTESGISTNDKFPQL